MSKRWWWKVPLALLVLHLGLALCHVPISRWVDWLLNLQPALHEPSLRVPDDGKQRVVVLVHGMFRTSTSMLALQRMLEQHGYQTVAFDYWSNHNRIETSAAELQQTLHARFAGHAPDELHFVAHSMGGLVCQEYLRRNDALAPSSCVYIAVPHRGAMLAELRRRWFVFRWIMGETGALQLAPADPLHQRPIPLPCPALVILGTQGPIVADSRSIDGPDDGTIGVAEASLPGATDTLALPTGHTAILTDERTLRATLRFLRQRSLQ